MAESTQLDRMPNNVTGLRHELKHYFGKWQNARNAAKRVAEENEKRIENVIGTVEVVGAAWAISYWNGKSGPAAGQAYQLMGYDADLVLGAALVGLGLFELAGKYDEHLYSLGAGSLAAWATRHGWTAGGNAKTAGGTATATNTPATSTTTTTGVAPAGRYVG